jgi:cellulose synthase/poly-beta-1,6-N-acetylglucosamine synthase-like glycosyltransferase
MALALIAVGVLSVWAALHPFTTYPLSLLMLRRRYARPLREPEASDLEPDMAILMCAYNEEHVIEAKMANLLALKAAYPKLEISVYVDAATDRTSELLRAYEDRISLHVASERQGKTPGMNRLMSLVTKPIVMFTDANVMIDQEAPARLMRYFADPDVGCVAAHLLYTNSAASITASSGSLYWRLEEFTKRLESDTGSCMGADGSLFAIRSDMHRAPPAAVCDDMYVSMMVMCDGRRVVQADDVIASEESVTAQGEEFQRKVRIACQAFNVHQLVWPHIRRMDALTIYKYLSHKWLRWWAIFFLAAGLLSIEVGLALAGHVMLAGVLGAFGALGLLGGYLSWTQSLAQTWDILTAFAGTGLGVLRSLRGHTYQTWTPAASIRK